MRDELDELDRRTREVASRESSLQRTLGGVPEAIEKRRKALEPMAKHQRQCDKTIPLIKSNQWMLTEEQIGMIFDTVGKHPPDDPKNANAPQNKIRAAFEILKGDTVPRYPHIHLKDEAKRNGGVAKIDAVLTLNVLEGLAADLGKMEPKETYQLAARTMQFKCEQLSELANTQKRELKKITDAEKGSVETVSENKWDLSKEEIQAIFHLERSLPPNSDTQQDAPQNAIRTAIRHLKGGNDPAMPELATNTIPKFGCYLTQSVLEELKAGCDRLQNDPQHSDVCKQTAVQEAVTMLGTKLPALQAKSAAVAKDIQTYKDERKWRREGRNAADSKFRKNKRANDT